MIKIENTEVMGWEHAIRGMRNPMNSWEKSDSLFCSEQVEQARELKLKYDAALVTLDEYSKRQELSKIELQREKDKTAKARQEADNCRDIVNTYKIQFNNAAVTKEQIRDEIISEVKAGIVEKINDYKGNLSKKKVCEIVLGLEE